MRIAKQRWIVEVHMTVEYAVLLPALLAALRGGRSAA
jgi:hypothetical protein